MIGLKIIKKIDEVCYDKNGLSRNIVLRPFLGTLGFIN
jgi:hypothetical protein